MEGRGGREGRWERQREEEGEEVEPERCVGGKFFSQVKRFCNRED